MMVNQRDEPVFEDLIISGSDFEDSEEVGQAVVLLAEKLGFFFVRTNATKHGYTEIKVVEENK